MTSSSEAPKRLADFEWASVAVYLAWLERFLGLKEINMSNIYSLRVEPGKVSQAIDRKRQIFFTVQVNMGKIEQFVRDYKVDLSDEEMVAIRGEYRGMLGMKEIIKEQIQKMHGLEEYYQLEIFDKETMDGGEEDNLYY